MSLYGNAVKRPIMTTLCFVAVVILGIFSLNTLPIDLYPDVETNTLMVMTSYQGASAQDIEQNVTRPLENVLNSVNDLKHITSKSREGISVITLEFEYGKDIDVLTNDVRDKLDLVSSALPDDAENPTIFKFSSDMIPIVMLSVRASESMPGLYKILDEAVANPLARINGVGSVSISGAPKREIHIYADPARLEAYGLTIEQISQVVAAENRNIPGGSFDIGSDTYSLRVQGEFTSSDQMAGIVVGSRDGRNIYLRDVARIDDSLEERAQQTYNDGEKGAMIIIQKQSGANSVEVVTFSSTTMASSTTMPIEMDRADSETMLSELPVTARYMNEAMSDMGMVMVMMSVALHRPRKKNTTMMTNSRAYITVSTSEAMVLRMLSDVSTIMPSFTSDGRRF